MDVRTRTAGGCTFTTLILLVASSPGLAQIVDTSLMTYDESALARHALPYVVELRLGRGALLYFGARHTNDPAHPQIARIEALWRRFGPTLAFNEGGDPPVAKSIADAVSRFGEPGLVRFLAARDHVPVRSLEPDRADEVAFLLANHGPDSVALHYALRCVLQYRRGRHDEGIEGYMEFALRQLAETPGLEAAPRDLAGFERMCLQLLPGLRDWREVPESWFDPTRSETFTNDIARLSSGFRDRHMVRLLTEAATRGERVFAVVGGTHVVVQEAALRAASRTEAGR